MLCGATSRQQGNGSISSDSTDVFLGHFAGRLQIVDLDQGAIEPRGFLADSLLYLDFELMVIHGGII